MVKSHLESWRPRKLMIPTQELKLSVLKSKSQFSGLSPKAKKKKKKLKPNIPSQAVRQEKFPLFSGSPAFLSYLDLQLILQRLAILGREICFTQSINSNVNLIQKHFHRHTQNNALPKSGYLMAQSSSHIKLTVTSIWSNFCL